MKKNNDLSFLGESNRHQFEQFDNLFNGVESFMGYLPNAHLLMAERPELLMNFSNLALSLIHI